MDNEPKYMDYITHPKFWADVTGKVAVALLTFAGVAVIKVGLSRLTGSPPIKP